MPAGWWPREVETFSYIENTQELLHSMAICLFLCFHSAAPCTLAEGMDVCLLWMLCDVQVEDSATGRSLVQGSPSEFQYGIDCDQVQQ